MCSKKSKNCRCVDLRTGAFDVPPQEILTRDSVTISVDAVVYYQVKLLRNGNRFFLICLIFVYKLGLKLTTT